jgi:hypothetical protein
MDVTSVEGMAVIEVVVDAYNILSVVERIRLLESSVVGGRRVYIELASFSIWL